MQHLKTKTTLGGKYRIVRVLGHGCFGIKRMVTILFFVLLPTFLFAQAAGRTITRPTKKSQTNIVSPMNSDNGRKESRYNGNTASSSVKIKKSKETTYTNIKYKKDASCNLDIDSVKVTSKYTYLFCKYKVTNIIYINGWYAIEAGAFIRDTSTGKKYSLIKTDNCAILPEKTDIGLSETKSFVLYFQPIPTFTKIIDFEESDSSAWHIFNISLK